LALAQTVLDALAYTQRNIKSQVVRAAARKTELASGEMAIAILREGPHGFTGGLRGNCIRITKVTRTTATGDLTDLLFKNSLRKIGGLKLMRYFLNL
jgi:hypothetical protein